mgnify:CR=1 FL=1
MTTSAKPMFSYTMRMHLRDILIANTVDLSAAAGADLSELEDLQAMQNLMKYAVIIVSSLPVLLLYPFVQRYFVKGITIGAVKG